MLFLVFLITAIFPFLLAFGAFHLPEKKICKSIPNANNDEERVEFVTPHKSILEIKEESNARKVFYFVKKPQIYKPIIFIFLFMMTPSAGSSMFFFYTNELKFHPDFMGQLKMVHSLANMLGIFTYHRFLKLVPFKKLFLFSTIICCITGLSQILLVTR